MCEITENFYRYGEKKSGDEANFQSENRNKTEIKPEKRVEMPKKVL